MSQEHQPQPSERNEQAKAELESLGRERLTETETTSPEQAQEHQEQRAEAAREAISTQEQEPEPAPAAEAAPRAPSFAAKLDAAVNYTHTVQSLQRQLSPVSRSFSRVIHNPGVEKASEVLEKTVMRPSITAGALWSAAIVGLAFYLVARSYGYQLSGSEMLVSLLGGAIIGGGLEAAARASRKHRS